VCRDGKWIICWSLEFDFEKPHKGTVKCACGVIPWKTELSIHVDSYIEINQVFFCRLGTIVRYIDPSRGGISIDTIFFRMWLTSGQAVFLILAHFWYIESI
jgi:hypothetical protein